jgi:hypothetical protein
MSCKPVKANRGFGRTLRLYLQGRRVIQGRMQQQAGSPARWFHVGLTLQPRRRRRYLNLISIKLLRVTFQKAELFTVTAVRTSNLTLHRTSLMRSSTISFKGRKTGELTNMLHIRLLCLEQITKQIAVIATVLLY